jgi:hypothetical protein
MLNAVNASNEPNNDRNFEKQHSATLLLFQVFLWYLENFMNLHSIHLFLQLAANLS